MEALDQAQCLIANHPDHPDARTLANLVQSLHNGETFDLAQLYELELEHFEIALRLMDDWRLQRYYLGGARAFRADARQRPRASAERQGAAA